MVQQIEKKYGDQLTFTWIDIAVYQESEGAELNKTAAAMKVQTAPALVLFDGKQKLVQTWMGELNQAEVSKAIEQVVK
ncbi:hypothetical protein Dred_0550 [Desulforamulus reducens MI-1]|uniref:Thioredoxin domain-containing protein n=1 Tax=Desulforamulus reducens (strain ATCC BAA-1160 / DSM 100696 / MI-1) TaxID=349161 RepID=A4J1Z1_DESRM|nr:hypothetical protein [Desulforamulus reducens]ABO49094.1 hypothetical protein Dred_0550 [Desulforamulus reducens MI-1]